MGNLSDFTNDLTGAEIASSLNEEIRTTSWQTNGVKARYWRWTFNENNNLTGGVTIAEIEAYVVSASGTSILTGGTASAERSSYGGSTAGAFDGNNSTYWGSDLNLQTAGNETWVQYDLGVGNDAWVTEYAMRARGSLDGDQMASGWFMSYSHDGVNWIRVHDVAGETVFGNGQRRTYTNSTESTTPVDDRTYGWDPDNLRTPDYYIFDNMGVGRESGSPNSEHFAVSKTVLPSTGIHYYEILLSAGPVTDMNVGLIDPDSLGDADSIAGGSALFDNGIAWRADGDVFLNGSDTTTDWNTMAVDDVLRFAWDADNDRLYWGQSGSATKDIIIPGTVNTDYIEFTGLSGPPHIAINLRNDNQRAELRTKTSEISGAIPAPAQILEAAEGTPTNNEIVAAINSEIGNDDWQLGGTAEKIRSALTELNLDIDDTYLPTEYTIDGSNPRIVTNTGGSTYANLFAVATDPIPSTGKWYWEINTIASLNNARFGITGSGQRSDATDNTSGTEFAETHGIGVSESNQLIVDGTVNIGDGAGAFSAAGGDIICFAYDADSGELWGDVNAAPNTAGSALATKTNWPGDIHIAMNLREDGCSAEILANASELNYTVPAGFTALGEAKPIVESLADIGDVDNSISPTDGQALTWDNSAGLWVATTVGGGGTVDVVSNVATNTILGRTTAGSGDSEELTPAQARDLLNVDETGILPITTLGVLDTVDLALTDAGRIFEVDEASSSYTIIRVPDDATLNLPIGFTFTVVKLTDSTVSYNPEVAALNASVSINGSAGGSANVFGAAYSAITVYKSAANSWIAFGSIA